MCHGHSSQLSCFVQLIATCVQTRKELDQIRTSLFSRVIGKRGTQKGGIKRTGSESKFQSYSDTLIQDRLNNSAFACSDSRFTIPID